MRKIHRFRHGAARGDSMQTLLGELSDLRDLLAAAYMRFDAATEPELIDACVYEINAAQSRYNYQLRLIKERGGEAAFKAYTGQGSQEGQEGVAWA